MRRKVSSRLFCVWRVAQYLLVGGFAEAGDDVGSECFVQFRGTLRADVEGREPYVMAGAPALLERAGPLVLELSPPQLERAGGLERLLGQLAGSSTHVHDLSRPGDEPVPASDLRRLLERLDGSLTDVLVRRAR